MPVPSPGIPQLVWGKQPAQAGPQLRAEGEHCTKSPVLVQPLQPTFHLHPKISKGTREMRAGHNERS